jgi:hypothetical protein
MLKPRSFWDRHREGLSKQVESAERLAEGAWLVGLADGRPRLMGMSGAVWGLAKVVGFFLKNPRKDK